MTAHYAGDGTFLASDSASVSVIVNPESSLTTLGIVTPTSNNATSVVYGSPYVLAVQVTNSGGVVCNPSVLNGPVCPTGTVTLTDNGNPLDGVNGNFTLNSLGEFEDQPIQLFAGIQNIKAVYAGDNSFSGSTSATDVVTVTQGADDDLCLRESDDCTAQYECHHNSDCCHTEQCDRQRITGAEWDVAVFR